VQPAPTEPRSLRAVSAAAGGWWRDQTRDRVGPTRRPERISVNAFGAGALIVGITVAAAARQLGVSRSWASREANAPGTRSLIAELFEANSERINAVLDQMLAVIEAAFQARKIVLVRA
jgi:hypothetical protein